MLELQNSLWSFEGSCLACYNFFTLTQPRRGQTNTDVSCYSSFQCLEGRNKVGWNTQFHCLHGGPGYHSAGRASSNICAWIKYQRCFSQLGEPAPKLTELSVLYSPLHSFAANIILPATYPFHVVSLLSAWTALASLLSKPARCATLLQRLTNYKSSSKCHKEDFIEDKWKWAALVATLNRAKARIERLATRDANDAWQGSPSIMLCDPCCTWLWARFY